jgi:glyoxylase-like metal-dependent hydrolase (beta-lactamase superfamily II)
MVRISTLLILLAGAGTSLAHGPQRPDPVSLEDGLAAFGWNFDVEVTTEEVSEGFYVLFGLGGNVAVSSGADGVLIVDDQFPEMVPKLKKAMRRQGDKAIDFVVNTHWHFDHADGNKLLGKSDTWLVSQANSRRMMLRDNVVNLVGMAIEQPAYPAEALPDITFDSTMQFHLNGERIDLLHTGPAHTTGDTAVIFRGRNAVHLGDVYNNAGYPFIDAGNGGSLDGVISFCRAVLAEIDEKTVVIPGHGPLASKRDLSDYVLMLEAVRDELLGMIREGKSLEEVLEAGITEAWDERRGDPEMFINRSYTSLTVRYVE